MGSLNLSQKTYLIIFTTLLVLLVQSVLVLNTMSDINESTENQSKVIVPLTASVATLQLDIVQVQQWLTDISATRAQDGLNDGFESAEKFANQALQQMDIISRLLPSQQGRISSIRAAFTVYYDTGKKMAHAYINGGPAAGNKIMGEFDQASESLQNQLQPLLQAASDLATQSEQEVQENTRFGTNVSIALLVLAILITGLLTWFVKKLVLKPLGHLEHMFASLLDGKANLTFRFNVRHKDEIGNIKHSFNLFLDKIFGLADELRNKSENVVDDLGPMEELFAVVEQNANRQISHTDSLSAAMNELSATSRDVTENTRVAAERITLATSQVQDATALAEKNRTQTEQIASSINTSAQTINELNSYTKEIVAMVGTIRNIADQTNLLALNAAIEAARAGEQGRGFAVVADEVRALASNTQKSTTEIDNIITTLQATTQTAVNEMTQCRDDVSICVTDAEQCQQELVSVQHIMAEINEMTFSITTAMNQQTQVVEENSQSLSELSAMSYDSEKGVTQARQRVTSLHDSAHELKSLSFTFSGQ